jgi:hypothetical protein
VHQDLKKLLGMSELFSEYMSEEAVRRKGTSSRLLIAEIEISKYTETERENFMMWLSDVDYRGDHQKNFLNILKDSGDWMLSHEQKFGSWKEGGTVLWLRGIRQWFLVSSAFFISLTASVAGAGKTKLTYVQQFYTDCLEN